MTPVKKTVVICLLALSLVFSIVGMTGTAHACSGSGGTCPCPTQAPC